MKAEDALQKSIIAYLELVLPNGAWFSHFPAGGGGKVRGARLKSLGLKAGVPDILILWRSSLYCLEIKTPGKYASKVQKATHLLLREAGARVGVVRGLDDVRDRLSRWDIPSKITQ